MKKLIAIFLLIVYRATVFGVSINCNCCNGQLKHISSSSLRGKIGCPCNPEGMPMGYCKDVPYFNTTGQRHSVQVPYTINSISFTSDLPSVNNLYNMGLKGGNYIADISSYYVRRSSPLPIYLLIRVFRI